MQAQETTTVYLLKLWPWVEANKNRLIGAAVVLVAAICIIWFMAAQRDERETAAGQALTQLAFTPGGQTPEAYLKIAADYAGTAAGQRAQLEGAAALFTAGRYADAQKQFQGFLDEHSDSQFSAQATLGVAASLEAQGRTEQAIGTYQRLANNGSDTVTASVAKLALGRMFEVQGRLNDALANFEEAARSSYGSSLGSEAGLLAMELRNKMPAAAPASLSPGAAAPVKPTPQ